MSLSVGSSYSNPYAYLQYLLRQNTSSSATAGQTSSTTGTVAQSANGTVASYISAADGTAVAGSSVQFGPQTFFALLGMQGAGSGSFDETPWSQPGASDASGDNDTSWGGRSWGSQVQEGQFGRPPFAGMAALLTSADSGATSQTTTNVNGSTTYTITYADGSTVALTTPASSDTTSSASSNSTDGASTAANNPLELLIETLAQSLNTTSTSEGATGTSSGTQVDQGQFGPRFGGAAALQASANSGATSQTTTNANGSTDYTITYADGSTVTLTTPASSSSASSSDGSSTADNTSSTSINPLEQAIEMLADSLNSATGQGASNTPSEQPQSQFGPPAPFGAFGSSMLLSTDSGATSQTTTNANGSTTYTISYPDGSTVTMTTAAASSDATSSNGSNSATSTTGTYNNLLEQLIEMQAQLLNSTTPPTIATA